MALRRSGVRLPLSPPSRRCVSSLILLGETHFCFQKDPSRGCKYNGWGIERSRERKLACAIETLYQLSYIPVVKGGDRPPQLRPTPNLILWRVTKNLVFRLVDGWLRMIWLEEEPHSFLFFYSAPTTNLLYYFYAIRPHRVNPNDMPNLERANDSRQGRSRF